MKKVLFTTLFSLLLASSSLFAKEEITITSEDGYKLYGWLEYPAQKADSYPLAFFAHQFGADHTIWNELAKSLRAKGYATLNVDLRGHGKSIVQNGKNNAIVNDTRMDHIGEAIKQSREKVGFETIPSDLALWLDHAGEIENLNMGRLVLLGSSLGGGAILPLAIDYEPKAIIAISPGGGDADIIKESISIANTASLFIAGKNDPLKAQDRALEYTKQAMRGTNLMISSSGHGTVLLPFITDYIHLFLKINNKK